jgi:hypothetical protein
MATSTAASVARLRKRLARVPIEVRAAAAAQAAIEANNLTIAMKGSAPKDDGVLVASVRMEVGRSGDQFVVKAGGPTTTRPVREGATATFDYSLASEFGREGQPARGWFYPTYRARRKKIRRNIEQAALAAARKLSD